MSRRNRWADFVPPDTVARKSDGIHISDSQVFFGAQLGWSGDRDLTMGRQDESGRWHEGYQRWSDVCPNCGGDPERMRYCEGCTRLDRANEARLSRRTEDEAQKAQAAREAGEKRQPSFAKRMHGQQE